MIFLLTVYFYYHKIIFSLQKPQLEIVKLLLSRNKEFCMNCILYNCINLDKTVYTTLMSILETSFKVNLIRSF